MLSICEKVKVTGSSERNRTFTTQNTVKNIMSSLCLPVLLWDGWQPHLINPLIPDWFQDCDHVYKNLQATCEHLFVGRGPVLLWHSVERQVFDQQYVTGRATYVGVIVSTQSSRSGPPGIIPSYLESCLRRLTQIRGENFFG